MVCDGLSITGDGVLLAKPYTLPTANETLKGGVKIGSGLTIDARSVVFTDTYELAIATTENLVSLIINERLT